MVSLILFGSFVIFLILNTPIGIALGLAAMSTIVYSGDVSVSYLAQSLTTSADSFPLMAVPFLSWQANLWGKAAYQDDFLK